MTVAQHFLERLFEERQRGNVSQETEQHLKHEIRRLGRDTSDARVEAAVGAEIERLAREVATLRKLQAELMEGG